MNTGFEFGDDRDADGGGSGGTSSGGSAPSGDEGTAPSRPKPVGRHPRPRAGGPEAVSVPGFITLHDRTDLKRFLVRWSDIGGLIEPVNPKDGVKILLRGFGHLECDESYNTICARMAECIDNLKKEDKGY